MNIEFTIPTDYLVTDTFLNQLIAAINSKTDSKVSKTFDPTLDFVENFRMEHTLEGDTAIELDTEAEHESGVTGRLIVTADGLSTLIIPEEWVNKNEGVFNTEAGAVNIIDLEYESGKVLYSIY